MKKYIMIFLIIIISAQFIVTFIILGQNKFGKLPSGERLARVEASPNYKNGKFHNLNFTPELTEGYSMWRVLKETIFTKNKPKTQRSPFCKGRFKSIRT